MSVDPLHSTIEEFAAEGYKHIECCPRWRVIQLRVMSSLPCVLIVSFLLVLAGCATSSASSTVGQVQEIAPGTYKIGVAHTVRIGNEMETEAVSQAGQYCHAKGQKLIIVPSKDRDVTFRCGEMVQQPTTPPPPN
jgi:hypothetical protein